MGVVVKMSVHERGDTIIEVMLSFTVFSLLAIGVITIMNSGINSVQKTLELTLVRQQIDAQAESLRFINQSYIANLGRIGDGDIDLSGEWSDIRARAVSKADLLVTGNSTCPAVPADAFVIDSQRAALVTDTTKLKSTENVTSPAYAQTVYDASGLDTSYGIWVQAQLPDASEVGLDKGVGFIDFHINACWHAPGDGVVTTTGTIVRLYDPK